MKKKKFLLNKYTVTVFILLAYFAADVFLHKGMSRVLLGSSFTNQRKPSMLNACKQPLQVNGKRWVKAVNTIDRVNVLPADAAGFEMDVYFDTAKNCLLLYHDSTEYSTLRIEAVLGIYKTRKMTAPIWLDFKNLSVTNQQQSLKYIATLRNTYRLNNKMIIESHNPECLQSFCDSGFFTSYYTPFFNPYQENEAAVIVYIDSIKKQLEHYPVSALSGYYFQYPLLKKYFPGFPILTWASDSKLSAVGYFFNRKLNTDKQLRVILYPLK